MISRENIINMMNEQFRDDKCATIKRTLKGTIDMRYTSNIRIFSEIYKQQLINLNRRDNGLVDGPMEETNNNYRDEIINLTEDEIEYRNKIEVNSEDTNDSSLHSITRA